MFIIWLTATGVFILGHVITGDLLVRRQYLSHQSAWNRDGQPDGFFWRSDIPVSWHKQAVSRQYRYLLLWVTPSWVNQDAYAWRLLYAYRVTLGLAFAVIFTPVFEILLQDMLR